MQPEPGVHPRPSIASSAAASTDVFRDLANPTGDTSDEESVAQRGQRSSGGRFWPVPPGVRARVV